MAVSVADSVRAEVARLPADLRECALASVAVAMAEHIDAGRGSPSECGKVLVDVLVRLREMAPPKKEATRLDELSARRAARLERPGQAGAKA